MALFQLLDRMFDIGVFRFGKFTLKCGLVSPVYADMRRMISHPDVLQLVEQQMWLLIEKEQLRFDLLCGVPYGAIPLCSVISFNRQIPMVFMRKQIKGYGTAQLVEGVYEKQNTCLLVEDVVTHGSSVVEAADMLRSEGLQVHDVVIVLDRCQGAVNRMQLGNIRPHSLLRLLDVIKYYLDVGKISKAVHDDIVNYLNETSPNAAVTVQPMVNATDVDVDRFYLESRQTMLRHPLSRQLWDIVVQKKSNLCVSCDLTDANDILALLRSVGDYVCIAKIHADIVDNFSLEVAGKLRQLARSKRFLLLEDRKLADIGSVVRKQLTNGVYKPSQWADLITVHAVAGPGTLDAIRSLSATLESPIGCLLVKEMSCHKNLINNAYKMAANNMALEYSDVVVGFVCQKRLDGHPSFVYLTPGVHCISKSDNYGQCYRSLQTAIKEDRNDIAIVGRGITDAQDAVQTVQAYKEEAWNALSS